MFSVFKLNLKSACFINGNCGGRCCFTVLNKYDFFTYNERMTAVIINKTFNIAVCNFHKLVANFSNQKTSVYSFIKIAGIFNIVGEVISAYIYTDTDNNIADNAFFKIRDCLC